ncbi:S-layer homology domain-containing protein [Paenibacillus qinlingensis]|uniref:SLH domain-containing protein n=1 Tax=Paenibacillus qinlingensis TaxID=1837343 RepID=A0ABU1P3U1_9BACL|nr:S-layer homology domain-containing protein [Paenibacillus qinlingensis]MDR6554413.1 hypothetical protein [Paenibacillus qinlingensis]
MKIKIVAFWLMVLLIVSTLPNPFMPVRLASAAVIDISTPAELAAINASALSLAGEYRLTSDINLAGYDNGDHEGWLPLGNFTGTLDGNGYTIRNMTIDRPNTNNIGLFSRTTNATITNVHLTNITVKGFSYVGGIAGDAYRTSISNSYAEGNVTGNGSVGLLVGYNDDSNISDSYAQGQVSIGPSPDDSFGGGIGYSSGTTNRVYATTSVASGTKSGGLIGTSVSGGITSSYWNTETSGRSTSDGGIGKTTAEMKRKATYVGWDFTNTWGLIEETTYPLLRSDYTKVALTSLTVEDSANHAPQALNRTFSSDYGVYIVKVLSKTDHVIVAGTALSGTSDVSVQGGSGSEILSLNPGQNDFQIKVSDAVEPTRLNAIYKLTVIRDAGTIQYPHRITTATQLSKIGDSAEGYGMADVYSLENDLDLSTFGAGAGWMPVGTTLTPFTGSFDGKDHTIANIGIQRSVSDGIGLFGSTSGATIKNIALLNTDIHGKDRVGGLIGEAANTTMSGVSVQGAVYGVNKVGGLIGSVDGVSTTSESYSAAAVSGSIDTGGLIGVRNGGTVSNSFWDINSSGQVASAGGTGLTTQQMMQQATFTAAGWEFGSGKRWGMIEGTTYPMPYASFGGVLLSGMTVTAPGATVSLNSAFDSKSGNYVATLNTPAAAAHIFVTAVDAAGAHVAINGTAGNTAEIDLSLGDNPVEIRITDAAGLWQGVYRVKVAVPTPQPSAVEVPANGTYGIGQKLDFTVTFTKPVDVAGTPVLPFQLDSIDHAALYIGKPVGHPEKLQFSYTVQSGDLDADGIELGAAIAAVSPAAITALGETVSLNLPVSRPNLNGILVDGVTPTISLTPSATVPTNSAVTVTVHADGTSSALASLKWAAGVQDAVYFDTSGTVITGGTFSVSTNGSYAVFAKDGGGNTLVKTITIANIVTEAPEITLTYTPMTPVSTGVDLTVSATVYNQAAGNALTDLRWAKGEHTTEDFAVPSFGENVPLSRIVYIAQSGKYTIFAADSVGNKQVKSIEITNIISPPSTEEQVVTAVPTPGSFFIVPGKEYTLRIAGITLFIPIGAIEQPMTINMQNITGEVKELLHSDQLLLSDAYEIKKDVQGKFKIPVQLSLEWTNRELASAQKRPVLAYYDETTQQWVIIGGKTAGNTLAGQTDHFTKFAVIAVAVEPGLTDISGHWAERSIRDGVAKGLVNGYPNGTFRPDTPVSRAEFALMLQRIMAWPDGKGVSFQDQSDIPSWASGAVAAAVQTGTISGYPDNTFRPNSNINRAEVTVLIAKAAKLQTANKQRTTFADDAAIAGWSMPYVSAAQRAGLVQGQNENVFHPLGTTTRAEAAVLLLRLTAFIQSQSQ